MSSSDSSGIAIRVNAGEVSSPDFVREAQTVKAHCRVGMASHWGSAEIEDSEMEVSVISGGLSNRNYLVKLSQKGCELVAPCPFTSVFLRIFGCAADELALDRDNDLYCVSRAGMAGIACRVLGTFPEGRCESFLEGARTWEAKDLRDPRQSLCLARTIATFHAQPLRANSMEPILAKRLQRWGAAAVAAAREHTSGHSAALVAAVNAPALLAVEVPWFLQEVLPLLHSPVVLCHGDLNQGNMMDMPSGDDDGDAGNRSSNASSSSTTSDENLSKDQSKDPSRDQPRGGQSRDLSRDLLRDRLRLVDFEFGGACFRGYDLANFFWECSIENQSKAFPGFVIDGDQFPCLEKRRAFLKTYLETFARVTARSGNGGTSSGDTSSGHSDTGCGGGGGNGASTADGNGNGNGSSGATQPPPPNYASKSSAAVACAEKEEDVKAVSSKKEEAAELEALLWEVECFGLASNLQWALWGVHRAPSPSVVSMSDEWSYLDYAVQRASQYHALKARLLPLIEERRKQQQQKQQQQQATAISSSSS